MMPECQYCAGLSVSALVELARKEFTAHNFPNQAYYTHHNSIDDLEESANTGCSFCLLVLRCSKAATSNWSEMPFQGYSSSKPECNNDESMYDIAKLLPVSDIKIGINSTHVYLSDGLDLVRVFDNVMVQIGPADDRIDHDFDEDDPKTWQLPFLELTLTAPKERSIRVGEYQIGRFLVDPDLGSPSNFTIARRWLSTCLLEHSQCCQRRLSQLPTRVIDVGSPNPYLMDSQGTRAQYVALSHCWGGHISTVLTTKTLATFKAALPYSSLSTNFRDAITITKELGIQYLWIDSLCILQNLKSDWERESKKMGTYYRDATMTISAEASPGSNHGILKRTSSPDPSLGSVPLRVFTKDADDAEVLVDRHDPDEENLRSLSLRSPLSRRGWTFQETVLSSRVLYYGNKNIFWRCRRGFESASGLPAGNTTPEDRFLQASAVFYGDNGQVSRSETQATMGVLEDYYELVSQYSHRQLSFDSDKLPAFSGLSQLLQSTIDSTYLAGLWSGDVNHGLLWYCEMRSCEHVHSYRAPSWSWAITNQPVIFASPQSEPSKLDMQLKDHSITLRDDSNPFGELISAHITVNGFTMPLVRSKQVINSFQPKNDAGSCYFDEPADTSAWEASTTSLFLLTDDTGDSLLSVCTRYGDEKDWEIDFDSHSLVPYTALFVEVEVNAARPLAKGLIIKKVSNQSENTFERVGYFNVIDDFVGWLVLRMETYTRETLILI